MANPLVPSVYATEPVCTRDDGSSVTPAVALSVFVASTGTVIATNGIPGVTPMVDVGELIRIVTDTGT